MRYKCPFWDEWRRIEWRRRSREKNKLCQNGWYCFLCQSVIVIIIQNQEWGPPTSIIIVEMSCNDFTFSLRWSGWINGVSRGRSWTSRSDYQLVEKFSFRKINAFFSSSCCLTSWGRNFRGRKLVSSSPGAIRQWTTEVSRLRRAIIPGEFVIWRLDESNAAITQKELDDRGRPGAPSL